MKRLLLFILSVGAIFAAVPPAQAQFNATAVVQTTGTTATLVTGVAGKTITVFGIDVALLAAQTLQLKCGATNLTGAPTRTTWFLPLVQAPAYFACVSSDLTVTIGASTTIAGSIWYRQQ